MVGRQAPDLCGGECRQLICAQPSDGGHGQGRELRRRQARQIIRGQLANFGTGKSIDLGRRESRELGQRERGELSHAERRNRGTTQPRGLRGR